MRTVASILWRRLDAEGHDACRLEQGDAAWQLDGAAVFRHEDGRVAQLHYRVRCDAQWRTRWATVRGWLGPEEVDLRIAHDPGSGWTLGDRPMPGVAHCVDLDLGFTPATNLIVLRRRVFDPGVQVDAPAAWLDLDLDALDLLVQRYERRADDRLWYEAPRFAYAQMLSVTADGFVSDYPGLWQAAG
ncbi:MAG: hypothetical protein EOO24_02350 [Comamonadaceae bacterium]|nr:MAG: hypothetical protein EOO24_02350 [Comamonadaceae bacterium]